jgi:hypothetical protein
MLVGQRLKYVVMRILMITLLCTSPLVACTVWPPFAHEASDHFKINRGALEELKSVFDKTGLVQVELGGASGGLIGRDSFETEPRVLDLPKGKQIQRLFTAIGISGVFSDRGVTYFPLNRQILSGVYYTWRYASGSDWSERPLVCERSFRHRQCGRCSMPLADGWWLEYKWHPPDPDVAKTVCRAQSFEVDD